MTGFDPLRLGPRVGGSGGMGRVLVRALLDTGVRVAVLDLPASLAENPPPTDAMALAMDGSDAASVEAAFSTLAGDWPQLDGFVNLAGLFKGLQPIADLPVAVFDEVIAGNLRCHFLCARAALPLLHRSGNGSLVSVASTMAVDVEKIFEGVPEEVYAKRVPMKRMAQSQDMAGPILFLLGAASGFVNGEMLIVDGGVYTQ